MLPALRHALRGPTGGGQVVRPRQFALVLLCGTVTVAGWCAASLGGFEWSGIENTATAIWNRGAAGGATASSADLGPVGARRAPAKASLGGVATSHLKLPGPAVAHAAVSLGDGAAADPVSSKPAVAHAASAAADAATVGPALGETAFVRAGVSAADASGVEAPLSDSRRRRRPKQAGGWCLCSGPIRAWSIRSRPRARLRLSTNA